MKRAFSLKFVFLGFLFVGSAGSFSFAQSADELVAPDDPKKTPASPHTYSVTAEIQQLSYKSVDDEMELDWMLSTKNENQKKYKIDASLTHIYDRKVDAYDKSWVTEQSLEIEANYDINRIWKNLGLTTHLNFRQTKHNDFYEDKYNLSFTPIGIKWSLYETDRVPEISLSYLPLYNYLEHEEPSTDPNTGATVVLGSLERSIQHGVRLIFSLTLVKEKLDLSTESWFKKVVPLSNDAQSEQDTIITTELRISYKLTQAVTVGFLNKFESDRRREIVQGLPANSMVSTGTLAMTWQ